jgi:hypothetical protein
LRDVAAPLRLLLRGQRAHGLSVHSRHRACAVRRAWPTEATRGDRTYPARCVSPARRGRTPRSRRGQSNARARRRSLGPSALDLPTCRIPGPLT